MVQSGSPFNSCWDMTAFRLVTLHTISNPWIYLLTRRQYRKAFWYIIKTGAFFFTCKKLCKTKDSFGKQYVKKMIVFLIVQTQLQCSYCTSDFNIFKVTFSKQITVTITSYIFSKKKNYIRCHFINRRLRRSCQLIAFFEKNIMLPKFKNCKNSTLKKL